MRKTLLRLVAPPVSSTCDRFTPSQSRSTSTIAALARPSSGGAVTATFSALACSPSTAFLRAPGCARTASVAPSEWGEMVTGTLQPLEERRTDPNQCRALLDGDLEVAAHPHRQVR